MIHVSFYVHQSTLQSRIVLIPATPPQAVPVFSGFDYVNVDAQRRRV
jgi:hypothetical protein